MKFSSDEDLYFELQQWQIALLKSYIHGDFFEEDMKRRIIFSLENPIHKYLNTHSKKITDKLKSLGVTEIPGNMGELAEFISKRDDMDLKKTKYNEEYVLYCDKEPFYTFKPHIANLAKAFLQKDEFDYLKENIRNVFNEKVSRCLQRMHLEWDKKLAEKEIKIPVDDEEFVTLVISQEDYKNRELKEIEHIEINSTASKKVKEKKVKEKKTDEERLEKLEKKIEKLEENIEKKSKEENV